MPLHRIEFPTSAWIKFLSLFLAVGVFGALLVLFYHLRLLGCSAYGYGPEVYLAQCAAKNYGDYEHGALGLQLEVRAIEHLERAQVVFLGHSHERVGFSAPPPRRYFETAALRFYNASLSGEYGGFFDFFLSR